MVSEIPCCSSCSKTCGRPRTTLRNNCQQMKHNHDSETQTARIASTGSWTHRAHTKNTDDRQENGHIHIQKKKKNYTYRDKCECNVMLEQTLSGINHTNTHTRRDQIWMPEASVSFQEFSFISSPSWLKNHCRSIGERDRLNTVERKAGLEEGKVKTRERERELPRQTDRWLSNCGVLWKSYRFTDHDSHTHSYLLSPW